MSQYSQYITKYEVMLNERNVLMKEIDTLSEKVKDANFNYSVMLEAQQLLSAVSEKNTTFALDYVTGVINKTLGEMFPYDKRSIYLEKFLHAGKYPHIKVKLINGDGEVRDLLLQTGTGLRQVVSFLFLVCLIELRKCRRIFIMDEILSGLHPTAKRVIQDIMSIFAEEGFQFIFVEHSGMENFGKRYLIEKPDKVATATVLDCEYNNEVFIFNPPQHSYDAGVTEAQDYESSDEIYMQ